MSSIVVRAIRENDGNHRGNGKPSKGRPIGVVVAISPNEVGVAFWANHGGRFDKKFITELATGRALLHKTTKIPNRTIERPECPGVFVPLKDHVQTEMRLAVRQLKSTALTWSLQV